jgi:hypothetical protein
VLGGGKGAGVGGHGRDGSGGRRQQPGDTAGYHSVAREFSLTEGAARGTRGHLGPGGHDQGGFVEGIMVLELGQRPGSR